MEILIFNITQVCHPRTPQETLKEQETLKSEYHASDPLGAWCPRKWPTLDRYYVISNLQYLICIDPYLSESYRYFFE